jgi:hypothetical protein
VRPQFLGHLADYRFPVRLSRLDGAADQAVEAQWIFAGRSVAADEVVSSLVVRRDEHRLHSDLGAIA